MFFIKVRSSALSAFAFFGTFCVLSIGYSAYVSLPSASAGDTLTASAWAQMKNDLDDLYSRVSNISSAGTNVGIGTASPTARLDISGSVKIVDGTQASWRILTSDANWLATWTDPSYQVVNAALPSWTVVSASNDSFVTSDVTLSPWIWLLNIGYYMHPSALNSCFDVHVWASATSWTVTTLETLPGVVSENAFALWRHSTVSNSRLVRVSWSSATVRWVRTWAWCAWASYTVHSATLTMIATKVR